MSSPATHVLKWMRTVTLRGRLILTFTLMVMLLVGLGLSGVRQLAEVERVSNEIRTHWLQDARILGDLNNYMSDFRAAEATFLLAATPAQRDRGIRDLDTLRSTVVRIEKDYESARHDPQETKLHADFVRQWSEYLQAAERSRSAQLAGEAQLAVHVYMEVSRRPFERSSDTLGRLTELTVTRAAQATAHAAETYRRARSLILTAMLLACTLLLGGIIFVTRSVFMPLLQLSRRMRAIAAHDTGIDIPGTLRGDEIGAIARSVQAFRDNALALTRSQEQLLAQTVSLDQALAKEQELGARQRNFVSMASHEIRTPLTIIDGHAQRLIKMSNRLQPADIADRGMRIRTAVLRMTHVVDGLLADARVLEGRAAFHPEEIDPIQVLRDACQAHREAARGCDIREYYVDAPCRMIADRGMLFQAISNLIANAIKYSPPHSPVDVEASIDDSTFAVTVRDRGIGFSDQDREHLFERYFRGSNCAGIEGAGVGLHLVATILSMHGGSVQAAHRAGGGSSFTICLPLSPVTAENGVACEALASRTHPHARPLH